VRSTNADGSPAMSKAELGEHLLELAEQEDGGEPKTGRRLYYLALSHGFIQPDMGATREGKASRDAAYDRITDVLATLRKSGRLSWQAVLDLTRELDEWQTYDSPREARAALRRNYTEDRWLGQPCYPVLIVEKDTLEPVCKPMAYKWQMPFASSRGYGSLTLQHDIAEVLRARYSRHGQRTMVYFVSDLDPSGLDLQRAWRDALHNFGVHVAGFHRVGLNHEQVTEHGLEHLSIEVKDSDSRAHRFVEEYGARCWEADVLPATEIESTLDSLIGAWLDTKLWRRRAAEIEAARKLL
jgi:hypothetical protein